MTQGSSMFCAHHVLRRFLADEHGATSLEYGLIGAGIAVVVIGSVQLIGDQLSLTYESIGGAFPASGGGGGGGGGNASYSPFTQSLSRGP